VVTEDGANLLNSSFGIIPTISGNVSTPVYPEPGWGAKLEMARGRWTTRAGWFLGNPARRSDPWHDGCLAIAEARYGGSGGSYTLGVWGHSAAAGGARRGGVYLLAQHALGTPRLKGFVQLSAAAGSAVEIPGYVGAGLDLSGPLATRPDDHLIVGIASASIRGERAETSCEFGYVARLTGRLNLQPDLQYVFHPGGSGPPTLLAMVRITLGLD
jgi:porin